MLKRTALSIPSRSEQTTLALTAMREVTALKGRVIALQPLLGTTSTAQPIFLAWRGSSLLVAPRLRPAVSTASTGSFHHQEPLTAARLGLGRRSPRLTIFESASLIATSILSALVQTTFALIATAVTANPVPPRVSKHLLGTTLTGQPIFLAWRGSSLLVAPLLRPAVSTASTGSFHHKEPLSVAQLKLGENQTAIARVSIFVRQTTSA